MPIVGQDNCEIKLLLRTGGEALLVDAVAQLRGEAGRQDGAAHLLCCHLAQLRDALVAVERRVRRANHVLAILERTCKTTTIVNFTGFIRCPFVHECLKHQVWQDSDFRLRRRDLDLEGREIF